MNFISQINNAVNTAIVNTYTAIPAAGGTTNYFNNVQNKIVSALNTVLPYVWILVALALVGVGLACIIGSDRTKEMAKSKAIYIVIGCAVVLGAMYLAKGIANMLTIGNFTV